jgi:hypothetical protein
MSVLNSARLAFSHIARAGVFYRKTKGAQAWRRITAPPAPHCIEAGELQQR